MSSVLLHIGFHKTATTYLQSDVFSNTALGFAAPWQQAGMWVRDRFILDHEEDFDPAAIRARFDADQADLDPALIRVVSDERFSGTLFGNWRMAAHVPARLKAVFPEARVMIGVREQRAMILSSYMQYLRLDGQWGIDEFIRAPDDPRRFNPIMPIDRLKYHRTIAAYQTLFGAEKVFVMPFERLRQDREGLTRDLAAFLALDGLTELPQTQRNTSIGPAGMAFLARANGFIKRAPSVLDGQAPVSWLYRQKQRAAWQIGNRVPKARQARISQGFKDHIDTCVAGYYAASNQRLQEQIGQDLGAYGYDL